MSEYTFADKLQLATWYFADKIKRNLKLSDPKAWNPSLWNLYGMSETESGVQVTEETALNLSSLYAGINIISSDIASLPIHLYKKRSDGKRKLITNHNSLERLNYRANPYMPAVNFRQATMAHILSWGNMYAEIGKDSMGQVTELWPIPPHKVFPEWVGGDLKYRIVVGGQPDVWLNREKVLHVAGLGYDGIIGYSVVRKAAESIGLSMASEKFGARYFGANTNIGGVVKFPRAMSADSQKNLRQSMAKYQGGDKSHRWMLLEQGMEVEQLGFSPDDSQFLQTRQFQVSEIARWLNMPPHKLKDLIRSTFSNIEEQEIEYYTGTITPWTNVLEQNYNNQLLTENEHRLGYYFKHSLKAVLRGNSNARADYYTKRFFLGTITPNEIRAFEDEEPLDTDYADKTYIQMNLTPLDDIDKDPVMPAADKNLPGEQPPTPEQIEDDNRSYWRRILDRDAEQVKLIEHRSVIGRDKISSRYYSLILDAAERIVLKEAKAVGKNIKNGGNKSSVDEFYKHMPAVIRKQLQGVISTYQEAIMDQAASEVSLDVDDIIGDARKWIDEYFDIYVLRHVGRSQGQINALLDKEDSQELVMQRMDEWIERRPEKIAVEESVRAANSATQFVFWSAGFSSVWRIRGAETCPYCQELNGRKVKPGQSLFTSDAEFEPKGAKNGPMKIRGGLSHPPLHQGCDCYVSHR